VLYCNGDDARAPPILLEDHMSSGQAMEGASSPPSCSDASGWSSARAVWALVVASARYWSTVAPVVHRELEGWRRRASMIDDPELRTLALGKLEEERFNAEAGAMLATLAPRAHRSDAVEAIVALQVLFDLLDGLTERPLQDPLGDGERLFLAFTRAVSARRPTPSGGDGGYLEELSAVAGGALARLPARDAVIEVAAASAARAAQAQIRMHAMPRLGIGQLREWAQAQSRGTGLEWREMLVGSASSVLAVHALIAAAADSQSTPAQAARVEDAYLSVCVVLTLLDGIMDRERDERAGALGYISLYDDHEELVQALAMMVRRASGQTRALQHGADHAMVLAGVVAYYISAPGARSEFARPLVAPLHRGLAPAVLPALALMRAWRMVRQLRTPASLKLNREWLRGLSCASRLEAARGLAPSVKRRRPERGREENEL
jgi:tetraprenyl-beta-curcumene synthase